jgi:prephenate dehydrogenase
VSAEPADLPFTRVAVIGLGLMGGSLAMALRGKCARLFGADPDPRTVELALHNGVVEEADTDPAQILPFADLVVLAAPVRAILGLLSVLDHLHPGPAVVLDLGSTKREITAAMAGLPERFDPVGGHPMCGKEKFGLAFAEAGLFRGAPFALMTLPRTSRRAMGLAEELAHAVDALPLWMNPESHDRYTAASSHLPYLVANALAGATPMEAKLLVGTGFRSTSRLAGSSPAMMLDILTTNRENILAGLDRFSEQLGLLRDCLVSGDEARLAAILEKNKACYEGLLGGNS